MKNNLYKFFQIYVWLIIYPISWIITALVAMLTIVFSLLINDRWASKWIAPWWGKSIIAITFSTTKVLGKHNVQKNQSYIIVCNHQSIYDTLAIYGYLPIEFKWVMKKELQKMPFVGASCKALGHVFVDRSNSENAKKSLIESKHKIIDGVSAFFFPEGTRSSDGQLINFKKGAFRMAKELNLPILPVSLKGANKIMAANSLVICPHKITLTIHPEIDTDTVNTNTVNALSKRAKAVIASEI